MTDEQVQNFAAAIGAMNIKANLILENQASIVKLLAISVGSTTDENSRGRTEFERITKEMKTNVELGEKMIVQTMKDCGL